MAEQTVGGTKDETSPNKDDDDSYFCDVCNIKFEMPKAYFSHVYSVSHLQRANAADKQASKARSTTSVPCTNIPVSISATESELKVDESSKVGTEVEKVATLEQQGRTADNLQPGFQESTNKPTSPQLSIACGSRPVELGGMPSVSHADDVTSQSGSNPSQAISGSTTVTSQAVGSVAVTPSDVAMTTALPGSHELSKTSTSVSDGVVTVSSSSTSEQQALSSSSSVMPPRLPSDVTMASKASAGKAGPLLSTPKIPSLMSMGGGVSMPRPQGGGFDPRPVIPPGSRQQQPNLTVSPNQKIPLLRSPLSVPPPFPTFSDAYSTPYMGPNFAPRPAPGPHHPFPLLPTPTSQAHGPKFPSPPVHSLMNRPTPGAPPGRSDFSRSWDPTDSFPGGDDPQPSGITVKEYHHGRPAEHKVIPSYDMEERVGSREYAAATQRDVKPPQKLMMGSYVEPLIEGSWVPSQRPFDDKGRTYHCQMCGLKSAEFLFHELHLAGLRHRKMVKGPVSKAGGPGGTKYDPFQTPFEKMDVSEVASHDPVFVTGLLDPNQTSSSSVKASASASSSSSSTVCYSELEQKLRSHPDPILGVDYLTEYRFLGGRLEYTCDLCDIELKSVTEVADHVTSTHHRLQYLSYNDVETYKSVNEVSDAGNSVREAAEEIEKKSGRKSRVRVKLESDDLLSDGQFAWIELKDDSIRPVSALPGHRLCTTYSKVKPHESTVTVDSIDSLFQTLALHSCLAANRPPSLARPLRRMDFITALGEFSMQSDKDAEICFQLANFLTIAVINFRRQMLPSLNAIDVSSIEKRLSTLLRNAEAVAQKIITTDSTELDIVRPESG